MGSDDGWCVFDARSSSKRLKPGEVSLTKTNIVLSEALDQQLRAEWVQLEFRAEPRTIRLRCARESEGCYKVSRRSISARTFYKHFAIEERGRFQAQYRDGLLVIRLQPS